MGDTLGVGEAEGRAVAVAARVRVACGVRVCVGDFTTVGGIATDVAAGRSAMSGEGPGALSTLVTKTGLQPDSASANSPTQHSASQIEARSTTIG